MFRSKFASRHLRPGIIFNFLFYHFRFCLSLFFPDGQMGMTAADPRHCLEEADITMILRDHSIANQIQETTITNYKNIQHFMEEV